MNRHQQLVDKIRALVREQGLKPGDRLPSERALAKEFGASRGGVREALRSLAEQGAVESRHGDGTYLLDPTVLVKGPARALAANRTRVKHVFDFRRMLEPAIARMAAERRCPRALERLKALAFDQQQAFTASASTTAASTRAMHLDEEFHLQLARATGNPVVMEVLRTTAGVLRETRSNPLQTQQRRRQSLQGHLNIITALEQKDPDMAERAMRDHLTAAERDALLSEENAPTPMQAD